MAYTEDEFIPLSLLSQYFYCPRRAGLIMLERQWSNNIHTTEGELLHERVHELGRELRSTQAHLRGIPLVSAELGLSGKADCIELIPDNTGFIVPHLKGKWRVYPVEY